jgi:hypothetical protein
MLSCGRSGSLFLSRLHTGIQDEEQPEEPSKDDALVLPDIKDQLRKKQMEEELARIEEEKKESVKKIKRSDIKAFTKVCTS